MNTKGVSCAWLAAARLANRDMTNPPSLERDDIARARKSLAENQIAADILVSLERRNGFDQPQVRQRSWSVKIHRRFWGREFNMRVVHFATFVLFAGISSSVMAQDVTALKPDAPTKIGDMEAVCTGVGLGARENPAWEAYPLKIEVAGRGGQYLGDIRATVSRNGSAVAVMTCDGPWILLKAAPGAYRVDITTEGQTASSNAFVPSSGQGHIIIRFPMLGGEIGIPSQPATPSEQPHASAPN